MQLPLVKQTKPKLPPSLPDESPNLKPKVPQILDKYLLCVDRESGMTYSYNMATNEVFPEKCPKK